MGRCPSASFWRAYASVPSRTRPNQFSSTSGAHSRPRRPPLRATAHSLRGLTLTRERVMDNDLGRINEFTRHETRGTQQTPASPADGAGQRAFLAAGVGLDPQRVEADSLNALLTNKLLSALPPEGVTRLCA